MAIIDFAPEYIKSWKLPVITTFNMGKAKRQLLIELMRGTARQKRLTATDLIQMLPNMPISEQRQKMAIYSWIIDAADIKRPFLYDIDDALDEIASLFGFEDTDDLVSPLLEKQKSELYDKYGDNLEILVKNYDLIWDNKEEIKATPELAAITFSDINVKGREDLNLGSLLRNIENAGLVECILCHKNVQLMYYTEDIVDSSADKKYMIAAGRCLKCGQMSMTTSHPKWDMFDVMDMVSDFKPLTHKTNWNMKALVEALKAKNAEAH